MSAGINLTQNEAVCLAHRIAAHVVKNAVENDTFVWEDMPMLGEHAWQRVVDALADLGELFDALTQSKDALYGVDSLELWWKAQG